MLKFALVFFTFLTLGSAMIALRQGFIPTQKIFKGLVGKTVKEVTEQLSSENEGVQFAIFDEENEDKELLEFYFDKIRIVKNGNKVVENPMFEGQEPDFSKCSCPVGTPYETAKKNLNKFMPKLFVVKFLKGSKPPKPNEEHVLIEVDENDIIVDLPVYKNV